KQVTELCDAAAAAYPRESCGLLNGSGTELVLLSEARPSANLAANPEMGFVVDPQVQFDALRELRGTPFRIVGHYHSHPNGAPTPSSIDVEMSQEPYAIWMIISVVMGAAAAPRAFLLHNGSYYSEIQVKVLP
ncbi:MAG: M67 family metallopeptidase, partial [Pseudomonadales bacterium]